MNFGWINNLIIILINFPTVAGTSIDAGYSNLRYDLDINRDGFACSNGVVYVIDGFLDYSFKNIIDEMKAQDKLKYVHFIKHRIH